MKIREAAEIIQRFCKQNYLRCSVACPLYDRKKAVCGVGKEPHKWKGGVANA